jgi:hypothetical protein
VLLAVTESGPRADEAARMLGLVGGEQARAALWQRVEAGAGATRVAAVAALSMAVESEDLERWDRVVAGSPSLLVRDAASQAGAAAATFAVRSCGQSAACWAALVDELVPELGHLDADLSAARAAWEAATKEIEVKLRAEAEAFHAKFGEGETADPAATEAMKRLRTLRDTEYAAAQPLKARLDALDGSRARVVRALRALERAPHRDAASKAASAAVFEAAKGATLEDVRAWAALHLERVAVVADRDRLVGLSGAEPADGPALHLLAAVRRLGE